MRWLMITAIIGIMLIGALGTVGVHGTDSKVVTTVSVVSGNNTVTQVRQGETVSIEVTVKNQGTSNVGISSSAPAYAYANIYLINGGEKKFVEKVSYVPRVVMYHVISLAPGESYTAKISWTVPSNITGNVEVDAWAGTAPAGTVNINVVGAHSNAHQAKLVVSTDAQGYNAGDTMYIYVENDGSNAVMLSEGFVVYDADGNVVANISWDANIYLVPGHTLVYTWDIPYDLPSGWYYVMPYGTNQYVEVYIF